MTHWTHSPELEDPMSDPNRTIPLPTPGDLRTCSHWSCLQRRPAVGPDPAAVMQTLEAVVDAVAASITMDAEVSGTPKPWETYEDEFLTQYWTRVDLLADPPHPKRLLAEAEFRGLLCLEQLCTRILPRLMASERPLLVNHQIRIAVPDGQDGKVIFRHSLARVGWDQTAGIIRAYQWRIDDPQHIDWMAPLRQQRTGIALQYLAKHYPGQRLASVQAHLLADTLIESECTPEDLRRINLVLRAQALLVANRERYPLGSPPVTAARN
jgi:hypothetical protein